MQYKEDDVEYSNQTARNCPTLVIHPLSPFPFSNNFVAFLESLVVTRFVVTLVVDQ